MKVQISNIIFISLYTKGEKSKKSLGAFTRNGPQTATSEYLHMCKFLYGCIIREKMR